MLCRDLSVFLGLGFNSGLEAKTSLHRLPLEKWNLHVSSPKAEPTAGPIEKVITGSKGKKCGEGEKKKKVETI